MFQILPQSTGNVVAIRINGKLVHQDYQQFIPKLEAIIQQYGGLRCYCEMTNFEGITWQAMMDEINFDVKHCNQIERCAIVSDSAWNQWMTDFSKMIFHNAQIECFTSKQSHEAWDWVTDQNEYAGAACGTTQGTNQANHSNNTTRSNRTNNNTNTNTNSSTSGVSKGCCNTNANSNTNTNNTNTNTGCGYSGKSNTSTNAYGNTTKGTTGTTGNQTK